MKAIIYLKFSAVILFYFIYTVVGYSGRIAKALIVFLYQDFKCL